MRRLLVALYFALLPIAATTAGLTTTDRMYVDGISISPKTGAVTLVLVIDLPLEDELTKPRARSKVLSYANWMSSKKFSAAYPDAKPEAGRNLLILHVPPKNALGRSVLEQVAGYAEELGFSTRLQPLVPKAAQ